MLTSLKNTRKYRFYKGELNIENGRNIVLGVFLFQSKKKTRIYGATTCYNHIKRFAIN